MADDKAPITIATRDRERDIELLIPVAASPKDDASCKPSSSSSSSQQTGREVFFTSLIFISWLLEAISGIACLIENICLSHSIFGSVSLLSNHFNYFQSSFFSHAYQPGVLPLSWCEHELIFIYFNCSLYYALCVRSFTHLELEFSRCFSTVGF